MENPTYAFRDTNLVSQLIKELRIKSKTVMSWSSRKKKKVFLREVYFISIYIVLDKLSEHIYFYISKNITLYTFCLFLKSSKTFSVCLNLDTLTSKVLNQELKAQWLLLQLIFEQ